MYPDIQEFIQSLDIQSVSVERAKILQPLIDYIHGQKDEEVVVQLNFICTHNSRRSHLCQVWAKTMAAYFGIQDVRCYSGGTETTAVYPMIIKTLKNVGLYIDKIDDNTNPTYKLKYSDEMCPMTLFSKTYDDAYNPKEDYAAIMTCGHAESNCPIIPNAKRISVTYVDPKVSDGTPEQAAVYAERSTQIATEMKYVFSNIK